MHGSNPVPQHLVCEQPRESVAIGIAEQGVDQTALLRRALWGLLALGVAARTVRYLLRFPLWDDESFLCVNFIDSSYAQLMGPLQFSQVAPLLYLWTEWTSVKLFGFHEWSLRLPAFISSLASLWLFRDLARRLLCGWAEVLAVGLFAVSYPMIRYAAEGKQYGTDQLVALLLWWLAARFVQSPASRWPLWTLAALAPFAVGMSFPAAFVGGAVSLLLGWEMFRRGRHDSGQNGRSIASWLPWLAFNGTLLGGFLGFTWLAIQAHQPAQQVMDECWRTNFPPLREPWRLPYWLLDAHAGVYLAFPAGGAKFASTGTLLLVLAGIFALRRRGERLILAMLWLPAVLHLVAAGMHRYPYGGHVKFSMYAGPVICLVAAAGGAWLLSFVVGRQSRSSPWIASLGWRTINPGLAAVMALSLLGVGSIARDFWRPTKTLSDQRLRDLARWFWFNAPAAAETACLKTDLGLDFQPATFQELGWAAMYLCNQKIYSPRHASGRAVAWDRISADRPLWCVEFRSGFQPYDEERHDAWLGRMQEHYTLVGRESYPLPMYDKRERNLLTTEHWEVYRFVPRGNVAYRLHPEMVR